MFDNRSSWEPAGGYGRGWAGDEPAGLHGLWRGKHDFYTGLPTSSTDVDNGVTNATEYDALGRPSKAIGALGVTGLEAWTQTEYDDINRHCDEPRLANLESESRTTG